MFRMKNIFFSKLCINNWNVVAFIIFPLDANDVAENWFIILHKLQVNVLSPIYSQYIKVLRWELFVALKSLT